MSQYLTKPYESFGGDINVKIDLSNYATKTDIKNVRHVDVSSFELISNLASLKAELDQPDKLPSACVDSSKLSDVVINDVVKKTEYDKLVAKVNNINTTGCVFKTTYDAHKSDLEKKLVLQIKKILAQVIQLKSRFKC